MKCAIILREFQRFDVGTYVTLFDNRNLFICDDEIYNKQVFSEDSVYCIFDYF